MVNSQLMGRLLLLKVVGSLQAGIYGARYGGDLVVNKDKQILHRSARQAKQCVHHLVVAVSLVNGVADVIG